VGSFPGGASPYGVMDMAGLVWEWVADWYAPDAYRAMFEANPTGPDRGTHKVLRGGSLNWDEWYSRTSARNLNPPDAADWVWTGFRCVSVPEGNGKRVD
jgi:formylglycine-generating enzyme required for sulfatase activity